MAKIEWNIGQFNDGAILGSNPTKFTAIGILNDGGLAIHEGIGIGDLHREVGEAKEERADDKAAADAKDCTANQPRSPIKHKWKVTPSISWFYGVAYESDHRLT